MASSKVCRLAQNRCAYCTRCPVRRRANGQAAVATTAKKKLRHALEGINRGIFGVQSAKQAEIHSLVQRLESECSVPCPTRSLCALNGTWRVLYSTIRVLGTKRSKLGLREFVKIGEMWQEIDSENSTATNVVDFSVTGFGQLRGSLTINASFAVVSDKQVNVTFREATLAPKQLDHLFRKNYDLLLSIFNPEGWLDITYVDDEFRIGRDEKDNIFVLERAMRPLVT
jgi:hypothetical protein